VSRLSRESSPARPWARASTDPGFFSSARSFPTKVGPRARAGEVAGYYVDMSFKAESPGWPPPWLASREHQLHVSTAQWGLGCFERYLAGEGEQWLEAARGAADYLVADQVREGPHEGAWLHLTPMRHSYLLPAPWISAMAQGEVASLLVRLHGVLGEERFAAAAVRGLKPMRVPSSAGGALAMLGGGPFFEEYPTTPPSFVLNGGIFALWGAYDVAVALQDEKARQDYAAVADVLASNIDRWDTGYWSLYDLFPHPLPNVASGAYHALHTTQLKAMQIIEPRPEFAAAIERFESYSASALNRSRAFAEKAAFRLVVPRNPRMSRSLPWSETKRQQRSRKPPLARPLVLGYHAVSDGWPSELAVPPDELKRQLEHLLWRGYRGTTFSELVAGDCPAKPLAVTFDDGYVSVYENAMPILEELGIPGTIFVPTSLIGREPIAAWKGLEHWSGTQYEDELRLLDWERLREMRDQGWEIGSHTCTHARLTTLDDDALASELADSRVACTEHMGSPCRSLAFPYGSFDRRVTAAARDAGYAAAATLRPGPFAPDSWPRIGLYRGDGKLRFMLKVSPGVRWFRATRFGARLERSRRQGGLAS
jgi:peptidoglycan/xylan/chitin deacetylase (PgdA/CDA1 family)